MNDGSPDDSLEIAIGLHEKDPRVKVVDLSRNFGHHIAMMAGLEKTSGSYVFLVDVDLEADLGVDTVKHKLCARQFIATGCIKRRGLLFGNYSS